MKFLFDVVPEVPGGGAENDARRLVARSDSFEAVLKGWLRADRRALIGPSVDDGQLTGVGVMLSQGDVEIGFASVLYADLYEAYPEVVPLNKQLPSASMKNGMGGTGREVSELIRKRRRHADKILYSEKLCTDIGTLKCAVRFALEYAASGCGEACFSLEKEEGLADLLCECVEEEKQGPFIIAGYLYRDPETGAGFGEDLTIITDGHPLFKSAVPV